MFAVPRGGARRSIDRINKHLLSKARAEGVREDRLSEGETEFVFLGTGHTGRG